MPYKATLETHVKRMLDHSRTIDRKNHPAGEVSDRDVARESKALPHHAVAIED